LFSYVAENKLVVVVVYWKNSKCVALATLARIYLTANASLVPCEGMFSVCGMTLNGRHSSLAPHTFNRLIFVTESDSVPRSVCSLDASHFQQ